MKKVAWILVSLSAIAGFGIATPVSAVTKAQLSARVLSLSNMPTGWSVSHSSQSSNTIPCLDVLKSPVKHGQKTSVDYEDGSLPALQEVVAAGQGEDNRYRLLNKTLAKCGSFSFSSDGQKVTGNIGAMSFPAVAKHSSAYAITLSGGAVSAGADVVLFESGPYVVAVVYEDFGTPNPDEAQAFVQEAVAKVEGKPTVTPTTF
jgi:hypothetical protein